MTLDRRAFLKQGIVFGGALATMSPFQSLAAQSILDAPLVQSGGYGPLVLKGDIWLPQDFNYQIISVQGQIMSDGQPTPGIFDGMAAYPGEHRSHACAGKTGRVDDSRFLNRSGCRHYSTYHRRLLHHKSYFRLDAVRVFRHGVLDWLCVRTHRGGSLDSSDSTANTSPANRIAHYDVKLRRKRR